MVTIVWKYPSWIEQGCPDTTRIDEHEQELQPNPCKWWSSAVGKPRPGLPLSSALSPSLCLKKSGLRMSCQQMIHRQEGGLFPLAAINDGCIVRTKSLQERVDSSHRSSRRLDQTNCRETARGENRKEFLPGLVHCKWRAESTVLQSSSLAKSGVSNA